MVLREAASAGLKIHSYREKMRSIGFIIIGIILLIAAGVLIIMKLFAAAGIVFVIGLLMFLFSWISKKAAARSMMHSREI